MILSDVQNLLGQEWAEYGLLSLYEKDQKRQWDFVKRTAAEFSAREVLADDCLYMLQDAETVMVCGPEGSGKTTLLSRLAEKLEESGQLVLPLFCHVGEVCDTPKELMAYIIDYLENILEEAHFDVSNKKYEACEIRLENLIRMYERRIDRILYIIMDGLEMVNEVSDEQFYYGLSTVSRSKVKVLVSRSECNTVSEAVKVCQLGPLQESEKSEMIQSILRTKRRQLDINVQRLLVQKSAQNNPLYLKLLIQRLLMMDREDFEQINADGGGMDAITSHQMKIINQCPDDTGICFRTVSDGGYSK